MKRFANLKFVAIFALLAVVPFAAGVYTESVSAHDGEVHAQEEEHKDEQKGEEKSEEDKKAYSYTAQEGDSYSLIARKAVQTYGLVNDTSVSPAQIIYAETNLTVEAGSPVLNVGEKVELDEATVKSWVEKAQKLSDEDKNAWDVYVEGADFNTDNVGE